MKKSVMIIIAIVVILLIIGGIVFFMLAPKKKAVTEEQFVKIAKEKGYHMTEIQKDTLNNPAITSAKTAVSSDYRYFIEFYILNSTEATSHFFSECKSNFENNKQEGAMPTEESSKEYEKYTLKSNGKYMYLVRVDNTIIQLNVNEQDEKAVTEFVNALGY